MKDEGSRNREDRLNGAQGPYLPAENKQQASAQLKDEGASSMRPLFTR